jgi:hypothetical protein
MSASPTREGSANAGSSNGNLDEKPRLSEHEKKANHIASGIFVFPLLYMSSPSVTSLTNVTKLYPRTEAPTSNSRRLRSSNRASSWLRGAGP